MSPGAGERLSEDLLTGDGSSYIGCLLKPGVEVFMVQGGGEEDSVAVVDEEELGSE